MRRWLIVVGLAFSMLVSVSAQEISASVDDRAGKIEFDEDDLDTARIYSSDYSVSLDEAIRRLGLIDELTETVERVRSLEEDRIAGWGIVHEPKFGGWILLQGENGPSKASLEIQARSSELYIETGADHTYAELLEVLENRGRVLARLGSEISNAISSAGISMRDNSIVFGVDRRSEVASSRDLSSAGGRTILAGEMEELLGVKASVVLEYGGPRKQTVFKGGQYISVYSDQGWIYCTAGFAATKNGEIGMLTAGHCADPAEQGVAKPLTRHYNTAQTSPGGSSELINTVPTGHFMNNYYGDVAFYTLNDPNDTFNRRFHVQRTKTKSVNGIRYRSQMFGHPVCHFGITSGKSCGEVTMINYDPQYSTCGPSGNCLPIYVKVEGPSLVGCGGDSGGPWHQGRKAYGTHSGSETVAFWQCSEANTIYSWFYPVSETESRLSVDILD